MKIENWKKYIVIMMTLFIALNICGCDTKKDVEEIKQGMQPADIAETTYEATELAIDGLQGEICSVLVKNKKIYIQTYEGIFENEGEIQESEVELLRFYTANLDGSNLQEVKLHLPEKEYLNAIFVEQNGTYIVTTFCYNQKGEQVNDELIKFDVDGKEILRKKIEELNVQEKDLINQILVDEKGKIVLVGGSQLYILDGNFQLTREIAVEDNWKLVDIAVTKAGQIICVESNFMDSNVSVRVRGLNVENGNWGEIYDIDCNDYSGNDYIMYGMDTDLYYRNNSGIYSFDIAEKKSIKLLDYEASYLTLEEADRIVPMGEGKFIGVAYHDGSKKKNSGLVVYSKAASVDNENRQAIIYGGLWINDDVKNEILAFNKENKEYRIEIRDYGVEEDPIAKMNTDIIAGNIPDIIDLSYTSAEKYVEMGLLEDLTAYLEKDSEISTQDIIDSVLEAMKIDGTLYYVAPGFSIKTIAGRTKDVGTGTGWTFSEMKQLLEKKGKDVRLFYDEASIGKASLLYYFLESGYADYIDWKTGKCSFNSQEFKELLEFCNSRGLNTGTELSGEEDVENVPSQIRAGEVLLYVNNGLLLEDIPINSQIFGEDITYIGYPNKQRQGSYFEFSHQIGISSKSKVKEEAWEFIRTFLTKEYQGNCLSYETIPTRQDCFEMKIKAKTTTKAYTDEFGNEIEPLHDAWFWGNVKLQKEPLSQEDVDTYISLVNNTKRVKNYDEEILEIIMEEAQVYFEGDKKLNKTVKIIQKRIETYVNEQR